MASDWLAYWRMDEVNGALTRRALSYASSNQLRRVTPGDTVWIVSVALAGGLITIGPLHVGVSTPSTSTVRSRLGTVRWPGRWYVFASGRQTTIPRKVSIQRLAKRLVFESDIHPHLEYTSGPKLAQSLQTMRRLSPASATAVRNLWDRSAARTQGAIEKAAKTVAAGDRQVVSKARKEQAKLRELLLGGSARGDCTICGRTLPASLLIASHIIPRSDCTPAQKRALDNVTLMCALGCDALFEEGFIEVRRRVVRSRVNSEDVVLKKATAPLRGRRIVAVSAKQDRYFDRAAELR